MNALRITALCLFLLIQFSGMKAQTVTSVFLQMPQSILPEVSQDTKKDLIEFYRNGNLAVMPSVFGGKVTLEKLSANYLKLKTSERSHLQMKLLRNTDSTECVVLVHTATGVLNDSRMQFYDLQFKPLKNALLPKIAAADFLDSNRLSLKDMQLFKQQIPNRLFLEYIFEPDTDRLVVKSSIKSDLSLEFKEKMEPCIQDSIQFEFVRGAFKLL